MFVEKLRRVVPPTARLASAFLFTWSLGACARPPETRSTPPAPYPTTVPYCPMRLPGEILELMEDTCKELKKNGGGMMTVLADPEAQALINATRDTITNFRLFREIDTRTGEHTGYWHLISNCSKEDENPDFGY